jgi:nitrogen regulatory protein PII
VKVEVIAPNEILEKAVDAIATAARTGKIGDGKLWVFDLDQVMRIRTGEQDLQAISE